MSSLHGRKVGKDKFIWVENTSIKNTYIFQINYTRLPGKNSHLILSTVSIFHPLDDMQNN